MKPDDLKPLHDRILSWDVSRPLSPEEKALLESDPEALELWRLHQAAARYGQGLQQERLASAVCEPSSVYLQRLQRRLNPRPSPRPPQRPLFASLRPGLAAFGIAACAVFAWSQLPTSPTELSSPSQIPGSVKTAERPEPPTSKPPLPGVFGAQGLKSATSQPSASAASATKSKAETTDGEDEDPLETILALGNRVDPETTDIPGEQQRREEAFEAEQSETAASTEALAALQYEETITASLASFSPIDPAPIPQTLPTSLDELSYLLN